MNESAHTFRGAWKQRVRALKNVPPLLAIVWHSGPSVVSAATLGRVVGALVPLSMLTVSKRILDAVQAHYTGAPLPASFWYLVGAEAALAVFGSLIGRATGYFDGLLADRFTRHVSIRVMQHASRLDLASYEDPVFYDKLERARVQATDRIAMMQAIGTVVQQAIVAVSLSAGIVWFSPWLLVTAGAGSGAGVSGREPLRVRGLLAQHPADAGAAAARLFTHARRQQGIRQGIEAVRVERVSYRRILAALEPDSTTRTCNWPAPVADRERFFRCSAPAPTTAPTPT